MSMTLTFAGYVGLGAPFSGDFMLLENNDFMLLENGFKVIMG